MLVGLFSELVLLVNDWTELKFPVMVEGFGKLEELGLVIEGVIVVVGFKNLLDLNFLN